MVSVCVQHFDFFKLPRSSLTNVNILCLVRFSSGQNKLVQLLIRAQDIYGRNVRTQINITQPVASGHLLPSFNCILTVSFSHFQVFAACG